MQQEMWGLGLKMEDKTNPKPNQASSRCRIAGQSSGWPPRQFRTPAVLPATAVPLPWIWLWRGLGTVRCLSDEPSARGVWSVNSRYEQLLSLMAGCVHTCNGVSWSCCLVCRGNLIFGPKRGAMTTTTTMMMTVAEIMMS